MATFGKAPVITASKIVIEPYSKDAFPILVEDKIVDTVSVGNFKLQEGTGITLTPTVGEENSIKIDSTGGGGSQYTIIDHTTSETLLVSDLNINTLHTISVVGPITLTIPTGG